MIVVTKTYGCPNCNSVDIIKNGKDYYYNETSEVYAEILTAR